MYPTLDVLLDGLLNTRAANGHRAIAGNFRMERRLPPAILDIYNDYIGADTPADIDEWRGLHKDFLDDHINLIGNLQHPWTFQANNPANLKTLDPITILRIESLESAIALSNTALSATEIEQRVRELHNGSSAQRAAAHTILSRFIDGWNRARDRRPQFATNLSAVQDMLPIDPWSGSDVTWISELGDHLGHWEATCPNPTVSPSPCW
jgi:hypothetical protein